MTKDVAAQNRKQILHSIYFQNFSLIYQNVTRFPETVFHTTRDVFQ